MLTTRLLENDSPSEKKSRNSTRVILAVIQSEDLINKIASYLGHSDYANLKASSIKLHGTIKTPNYAIRYAEHGIDAAESLCFIGECFYPDSYYICPISCYIAGCDLQYPRRYGTQHISERTKKLKEIFGVISCFATCDSLRCACCVGKYTLGTLFACTGFFAGTVKKNFCSNIREVGPGLLLPPFDTAGPKQQSM